MNKGPLHSVSQWLEDLGLGAHIDLFAENDITPDVVPHLTDSDLRELGLSLGHRKRLQRAIEELGSADTAPKAGAEQDEGPDRAERRQVTLCFLDLVGSTELSGQLDAEDMGDFLVRYHAACDKAISRYGGHVSQLLGDGVLAYFGYPVAHEDAAERAVRACLDAIQATSKMRTPNGKPFSVRAGVATGMVVVGRLMGDDRGQELSAVGDTPNLAARLQGVAEPDAVVISTSTRHLIGDVFEIIDLEPVMLKGFATPIPVHHVKGIAEDANRFLARRAGNIRQLVGRKAELTFLTKSWQQVVEGQGQMILVVGEAGIGKSRLIRGFTEAIEVDEQDQIELFGSPYHSNSAFWPILDHIRRRAAFLQGDSREARFGKLKGVFHLDGSDGDDAILLIADLLGIAPDGFATPTLSAQERRKRVADILVQQILVEDGKPKLLLLEDAHWLDPTTLDLITELTSQLADRHVMLLTTSRPGFVAPWAGLSWSSDLRLERLEHQSVTDIVHSVCGKPMPDEIVEEIVKKTDGVPLFVEELTKTVLESGIVRDQGDRFEIINSMGPLTIPSTLQDSLTARLDRLSSAKPIAQFAAAIGREFGYALLAASSEYSEATLHQALEELILSQLLKPLGELFERRYLFEHALIRDAAYQSMLRDQRRKVHAAIATTLSQDVAGTVHGQPELVAYHFDEADNPKEAVAWWRRAGELSIQRSATSEAARQLRAAIAANARLPADRSIRMTELELRIALSGPLIALQGYVSEELEQNYARAWTICEAEGEVERAFPVLYGQWVIPYVRGKMDVAAERGRRFLDRAEVTGDATLRMVGHRLLGSGLTWLGEPVDGARHLNQSLSMFDPSEHDDLAYTYSQHPRVSARAHLSFAEQALGDFNAAAKTADAAVSEAREQEHFNSIAYALCFSGLLFMLRRQRDEVEARARDLLRRSMEKNAAYWILWAKVMLGWIQTEIGDVEAGLRAIREPLSELEKQRANVWVPQAQLIECERRAELGHHDKAIASEVAARKIIMDASQGYYHAELHRVSAKRRALAGEPDGEIDEGLSNAVSASIERGAFGQALRLGTTLAERLLARGDEKAALTVLAQFKLKPGEGEGTPDRQAFDELVGRQSNNN